MKVTARTTGTAVEVKIKHEIDLYLYDYSVVKCHRKSKHTSITGKLVLKKISGARNGIDNKEYWSLKQFEVSESTEAEIASFIEANEAIIKDLEELVRTTESQLRDIDVIDEVKYKRATDIASLINALGGSNARY